MAFGSPDSFVIDPKVYAFNFISVYKILWHPDKSYIRDKVSWAARLRLWRTKPADAQLAAFFARRL
jgi:hypothetical protein